MTRPGTPPGGLRARRAFAGDRSGATALEFAMLTPALIAMLFGVIQTGWALYCGSAVRNAVQQASRTLITAPNTSSSALKTTVLTYMSGIPVEDLSVSVTTETVSSVEQIKRVSWTYDFPLSIPLIPTQMLKFDSSLVVPLPPTG